MVEWTFTREQTIAATLIATRAKELLGSSVVVMDVVMDLDAVHSNGTPLDLEKLSGFDDSNLIHDISGIMGHLDRKTGVLGGCFVPRCSAGPLLEDLNR